MTTGNTLQRTGRFKLPDPPPREPDEMTAYDHVYKHGKNRYLALHFGNPETTLVEYDRWIVASPQDNRTRARRPDLLIAFNVSPEDYAASNGYVVSEQGKPPDFVLEVASESTADTDTGAKRDEYAALGITEYWRFDETGEHHGAKLAGDRLQGTTYEPIPVDEGVLQGYSAALNLNIRWDHGQLEWHDPATGRGILTYEDQENRAQEEAHRAGQEREARIQEREARIQEREARIQAEARAKELEEELRRLRGDEQLRDGGTDDQPQR